MGIDAEFMVGRRIKGRRRMLGLTQRALGAACGVTFQQIQKYECGANKVAATTLWRIACALEVEIGYFFTGLAPDIRTADALRTFAPAEPRAILAPAP